MEPTSLRTEFTTRLSEIQKLNHWLNYLYGCEEFSSRPQQQVLGLLLTSLEYLSVNLAQLRDRLPAA